MSRLAIDKYGWVQTLNFLQLAVGMWAGGIAIANQMNRNESRKVIKLIFATCAGFLVLAAIMPTDAIENIGFNDRDFSTTGAIHVSLVVIFLLASPFAIKKLSAIFKSEDKFKKFANLTLVMGYVSLFASIIWFIFYWLGLFPEYRGIFQKLIAIWTLSWFIYINLHIHK